MPSLVPDLIYVWNDFMTYTITHTSHTPCTDTYIHATHAHTPHTHIHITHIHVPHRYHKHTHYTTHHTHHANIPQTHHTYTIHTTHTHTHIQPHILQKRVESTSETFSTNQNDLSCSCHPVLGLACTSLKEPTELTVKYLAIPGQPGWLSGLALPSAQGVVLETQDQVPRRAPWLEPASPSAFVSASLSVSFLNK